MRALRLLFIAALCVGWGSVSQMGGGNDGGGGGGPAPWGVDDDTFSTDTITAGDWTAYGLGVWSIADGEVTNTTTGSDGTSWLTRATNLLTADHCQLIHITSDDTVQSAPGIILRSNQADPSTATKLDVYIAEDITPNEIHLRSYNAGSGTTEDSLYEVSQELPYWFGACITGNSVGVYIFTDMPSDDTSTWAGNLVDILIHDGTPDVSTITYSGIRNFRTTSSGPWKMSFWGGANSAPGFPPVMGLSDITPSSSVTTGTATKDIVFNLTNVGDGSYDWTSAITGAASDCGGTTGTGWFAYLPTSGTGVVPGEGQAITAGLVDLDGCADGTYTAQVTFTATTGTPSTPSPSTIAADISITISPATTTAGRASCSEADGNTYVTYSAPSGDTANDIVYQLDGSVQCYEFINGDIGVVGPVTLEAITPNHTAACATGSGTCNHGWMQTLPAKPPNGTQCTTAGDCARQSFDSRTYLSSTVFDSAEFGGTFPIVLNGPTAAVKARSRTGTNGCGNGAPPFGLECIVYITVLSVLDSIPSDPGNTFRPPPYITHENTVNLPVWADVDFSTLSRLSSVGISGIPTFDEVLFRYAEFQPEIIWSYLGRNFLATENMKSESYHGELGSTNQTALLRFNLDDFDPTQDLHKRAVASYLQYGYDLAHAVNEGAYWSDHSMGRQSVAAWFAHVTNNTTLKASTAAFNGNVREGQLTYFGTNTPGGTVALFGRTCSAADYWQYEEFKTGNNKFCRDPTQQIDGPVLYMNCCMDPLYSAPLAVILSGTQATFNIPALLDFGHRKWKNGVWSSPDTCLSTLSGGGQVTETTCTPGTPTRGQSSVSTGAHGTSAASTSNHVGSWYQFSRDMRDVYYDCADAGNCTGLNVGIP